MPMNSKAKGFSLIELLIVIAIILVIAAIAIPSLLQARIQANEASAAQAIRTITSAEIAYYNAYPTVGFAVQLQDLGGASPCVASSTSACLIDSALSAATPGGSGKSGYQFLATGITAGTINSNYVIGATPLIIGRSGNRSYCSTAEQILRVQFGVAGPPVTTVGACHAYVLGQ